MHSESITPAWDMVVVCGILTHVFCWNASLSHTLSRFTVRTCRPVAYLAVIHLTFYCTKGIIHIMLHIIQRESSTFLVPCIVFEGNNHCPQLFPLILPSVFLILLSYFYLFLSNTTLELFYLHLTEWTLGVLLTGFQRYSN